jgi:hypothetical protein
MVASGRCRRRLMVSKSVGAIHFKQVAGPNLSIDALYERETGLLLHNIQLVKKQSSLKV